MTRDFMDQYQMLKKKARSQIYYTPSSNFFYFFAMALLLLNCQWDKEDHYQLIRNMVRLSTFESEAVVDLRTEQLIEVL